jgi:hypothetical protein
MKEKNKNKKSSTTLEVMKFLAVASAVLGALAILYFGGLSALYLATGARHYSGHQYVYPLNASINTSMNSTAPYFSGSTVRSGFMLNAQAYIYGLYSGVLMVLLGVVTLKYAKLKMKVVAGRYYR